MATTPNALFMDTGGYTTRITLPEDPAQRAVVIRAVTNSSSLEAVDLTDEWALWLDETGGMLGSYRRPVNNAATRLATHLGLAGKIRGPVVITGTSPLGTIFLTEQGLEDIEAVLGEHVGGGWAAP
ncbi:hypothetical protein OHB41_34120 [Streptomyces sp. NBC_01571]|uniref:hypothetical protein n=1 Tax=Streptomyces sp. NBC_01571 TaxID=2975883 RepID=UPI002257C2CF|nr:hypothetical protein [Streptomyces sp. NBC_01571]MCX4578140.1 hypothetical protein [Streptomyces sp. NBC_01571]